MPIELKANTKVQAKSSSKTGSGILAALKKDSFGKKYKIRFYKEFHSLLKAGVDMNTLLEMITVNTKKKDKYAKVLSEIKQSVLKGNSLAEAVEQTGHFSKFESSSIKAGEESGQLEAVFGDLLYFYEFNAKIQKTIIGSMSYPLLLIVVSTGILFFMVNVVVPMFGGLYERLGSELPQITQHIIAISDTVQNQYLYWLMAVLILILVFMQLWKKDSFRIRVESILIRVPFFGSFYIKSVKSRFSSVLFFLLKANVNLLEALNLAQNSMNTKYISSKVGEASEKIAHGSSLKKSLENTEMFSESELMYIEISEETNQLHQAFERISSQVREDLESQASIVGKILEPILITFVAIVIGTILVAMYMPLFSLSIGS
ncbi:type II secretion system F family protein [Salibacter halophilus]|uniref:Type II secretion system F family protein n=1 Tax=Salibacter halophilus TaxID=1803916 RepID=A0A6N6M101_9FLAO|nr:type II secretion system F family protein [Salibacter halophilus]KAB1061968.1 type II secretion system F family protein [Salibacter halophilus]